MQEWSASLITNYATRRDYSGKREHAYYDPPENGIHLCGSDIHDAAATAAVYPMSAKVARDLFAVAKEAAECGKEEADFVVDLFVNGDVVEDFWTNRQLWPRAIDEWNRSI
jgi:hypothetical protein